MSNELRNFLALSYDELEQLNLKAKEQRQKRVAEHKIQEERLKYLTDETKIKAVTLLFSDLEGRLHILDYDKKFLIKSWDNLTFDGSSIRGFTAQKESDLRLGVDWSAFYWGPADIFGPGKVMGFQNEKDHPEVAPSQFEINYGYSEVVAAADQIQIYKLICRQVATKMGLTACFLPKPVVGVNGTGMHTNVSVTKDGKNLFWDPKGEEKLSKFGWDFVDRILTHGNDICLLFNSSVNAYRRLDPHFEAPNQLNASAVNRGAMVRIPIGNERSMRTEVRAVAPDANPYMVMYSIFKSGLDGEIAKIKNLRSAQRYLPDNVYTALENFEKAEWTTTLLGADVKGRYAELKRVAADRCPRSLGTVVKAPEVQFHHEVYNQFLWNLF